MAATGNEVVILRQLKSFKDWVGNQLAGKAASSHNHAASNITSGTLTVSRGGTGITANPSMLVNLSSTSADTVFEATPRPGVTGTLPIARGGTGATSAAAARTALGAAANTTATTSVAGLMSAADKKKLDGLKMDSLTAVSSVDENTSIVIADKDNKPSQMVGIDKVANWTSDYIDSDYETIQITGALYFNNTAQQFLRASAYNQEMCLTEKTYNLGTYTNKYAVLNGPNEKITLLRASGETDITWGDVRSIYLLAPDRPNAAPTFSGLCISNVGVFMFTSLGTYGAELAYIFIPCCINSNVANVSIADSATVIGSLF